MFAFLLTLLASIALQSDTQVHLDGERWIVDARSVAARSSWRWSAACAPQKLATGETARCGAVRHVPVSVTDLEGRPVQRATVAWATEPMLRDLPDRSLPASTTDEQGRTSIAIPLDESIWMRVAGPRLGSHWHRVRASDRELRLDAVPASSLRVLLRGENRGTVARGRVVLLPAGCTTICPERLMALDDGKNDVTLTGIAGASYRLVTWSDSHAPATRNVSLTSPAGEITVVAAPGPSVAARLVDIDGKPVQGTMNVQFQLPSLSEGILRTAVAAPDGELHIGGLPAANVECAAAASGFARKVWQATLTEGRVDIGDVVLHPARQATVKVLTDSRGLAGAKVVARGSSVVMTDGEGIARFKDLPSGDVDFAITAPGFRPASAVVGKDDSQVSVALERGASVRATLIRESDGRSPDEVTVRITNNGKESRRVISAANDLVVSGLETGSARIRIFADGAEPYDSGGMDVRDGDTRDLGMIVLRSGAAIRGIVTDEAQTPVRDARVRVLRMNGDAPSLAHVLGNWIEVLTAEDGSFSVAGLTPGAQILIIEASGFARRAIANLEIDEKSGELDLGTMELSRGTRVALVCRPVARCGAEASILPAGPDLPFLKIDSLLERGRATFEAVQPGNVTLRLTKAKHVTYEKTIDIPSSDATEVVEIELPSLMLRGDVTLGSERARGGTVLFTKSVIGGGVPILTRAQTVQGNTIGAEWLGSFGASVYTSVTDRGAFELEAIEPGEYDVVFRAGGASTAPIRVRLPDVKEHSLPLRFEAREVAGVVEDADHRATAARIEVIDGAGITHATNSAPDGQFRILGLSAGRATVKAWNAARQARVVVDPADRDARNLVLRLSSEETGGIDLTVEADRGQPAAGALVFVFDGGGLHVASTDRDGRAVFRSQSDGDSCAVAVHRLGGEWAFARVRAGTPSRVVLPSQVGSVVAEALGASGAMSITTPNGFPLDRVLPMVGISPRLGNGQTLRLSGLPAGSYAIGVGMLLKNASVVVGETTTVRFDP